MKKNCILLRYGELALKGKNKKEFENQLVDNIRQKVKRFPGTVVTKSPGRIYIDLSEEHFEPVIQACSEIFGLVGSVPPSG